MLQNLAETFADNWAYLRAELHWLDRLLMAAVARQRKDSKELDRLSQSRADRVTSHWWKGVIALDCDIPHDEVRKPQRQTKISYQQQLDMRILASVQQGVALGLPQLRDRLKLSSFEKNLVVLAIAPEINRRYARLYRYLQGEDAVVSDLPTIDLALRLLCRTDSEWRTARTCLTATLLRQHGLLRLLPIEAETLLSQSIQLDHACLNYLLAEQPLTSTLDALLQPCSIVLPSQTASCNWNQLVLPPALLDVLQQIVDRQQTESQLAAWGFPALNNTVLNNTALLTGAAGTGKTLAANAIAHALQVPLVFLDLACVEPEADAQLLDAIATQAPTVLLIASAHLWFGRTPRVTQAALMQFLQQRRGITLLETRSSQPIRPYWQQQIRTLTLPLPSRSDRQRLWQQAFPPEISIDPNLPWSRLAQWPLSGGEINKIAHEAAVNLARSTEPCLRLHHIESARHS
jgi:hypothetical protein